MKINSETFSLKRCRFPDIYDILAGQLYDHLSSGITVQLTPEEHHNFISRLSTDPQTFAATIRDGVSSSLRQKYGINWRVLVAYNPTTGTIKITVVLGRP